MDKTEEFTKILIYFAERILGYSIGGAFDGCLFDKDGKAVSKQQVVKLFREWLKKDPPEKALEILKSEAGKNFEKIKATLISKC